MMRWISLVLLGVLFGCGYHVVGTGNGIPAAAHSITISTFENRTHDDGLEVALRRALEDEFRRRGGLEVVPEQGDLVLSGVIRRLANVPVTRIGRDQAVQYQGTMQLSLTLKERNGGRVLFANKSLQESQDFGVVSGAVIASSPRFQRGLINARDLPEMTSVQLTESRRAAAVDELLEVLARDIYQQTMEGF